MHGSDGDYHNHFDKGWRRNCLDTCKPAAAPAAPFVLRRAVGLVSGSLLPWHCARRLLLHGQVPHRTRRACQLMLLRAAAVLLQGRRRGGDVLAAADGGGAQLSGASLCRAALHYDGVAACPA